MYQFHNAFQGAINYFYENINEIHYKDGNLEVNSGEKIEILNDNSIIPYILIDTNPSNEETQDYLKTLNTYETGIVILDNKLIFKNELLSQQIEYLYSDIMSNYSVSEFYKQDILNFISNLDLISVYISVFIVMYIYVYIIYSLTTFVDVIVLAVLGFIIGRIAGMRIRFKATFNIGIYALTLPILLNLIYIIINTLTGFTIKYFSWMYTTISYIYVIVAILMIKTDFINKQLELMKIVEEQQRVREEMKLKEEQKKKEEKNENDDNKGKDDEEKKKSPKEKKGLGDNRISTTRSSQFAKQ